MYLGAPLGDLFCLKFIASIGTRSSFDQSHFPDCLYQSPGSSSVLCGGFCKMVAYIWLEQLHLIWPLAPWSPLTVMTGGVFSNGVVTDNSEAVW